MAKIIETKISVDTENSHLKPSALLAEHTGLSQAKIKDAMQKGAVWLLREKSHKRLRRASKKLCSGDQLAINFNDHILNQDVPLPRLIEDLGDYSVWYKPCGLSCQGSRWGDFASICRWVEMNILQLTGTNQRPVYLVHRLDRATTGLILLCHSKSSAKAFSQMFAEGKMDKRYQAIVTGDFSVFPENYKVEEPIDGKRALSLFSCIQVNNDQSLLEVKLKTGRKHQIRKHLKHLGFPILGDRLYGTDSLHQKDLQLQAVSLGFQCPVQMVWKCFKIPEELMMRMN